MKTTSSPSNLVPAFIFIVIILALLAAKWVYGQPAIPDEHAAHHPPPAAAAKGELGAVTPANPMPAKPTEKGMGMMGMMNMMKGGDKSMAKGSEAAESRGCQCEMMAGMKNEPAVAAEDDGLGKILPGAGTGRTAAATPGVAGTSHLFPIGARGFFLDQADRIGLLPAQARTLRQLCEKTFLEQAEFGRKLASSEQALWVLATADAPDPAKINAQLGTSESIRTARRVAYAKAVIEAIGLLSDDQRQILLGTKSAPGH